MEKNFTLVNHKITFDHRLSLQAKGLYAALKAFEFKDGRGSFPSQAKLADRLNSSESSIKRYTHELKKHGYVKIDHIKGIRSNHYSFPGQSFTWPSAKVVHQWPTNRVHPWTTNNTNINNIKKNQRFSKIRSSRDIISSKYGSI